MCRDKSDKRYARPVYRKLQKIVERIKDLNKWRDMPCSWTGRLNIFKMSILPKMINRVNIIPIKNPSRLFWKTAPGNFLKS